MQANIGDSFNVYTADHSGEVADQYPGKGLDLSIAAFRAGIGLGIDISADLGWELFTGPPGEVETLQLVFLNTSNGRMSDIHRSRDANGRWGCSEMETTLA